MNEGMNQPSFTFSTGCIEWLGLTGKEGTSHCHASIKYYKYQFMNIKYEYKNNKFKYKNPVFK